MIKFLFLLAISFALANAAAPEVKRPGTTIGIDLGTTYSCVGVFKNGKIEIIANDQGNRITPSYVAFTDNERLVGDAAKNQATINPENTIFDAKRLIGRKFNDKEVQHDIQRLPYKVVNKDGKPFIQVTVKGKTSTYAPEEISAMVLNKMRDIAVAFLGKEINDAVITVPAYFNNAQRQATSDAGTIAGLKVARIINEPTAAAIAYGLDKKEEEGKNILVFDLGGGTFDVSLLTLEKGVFEVVATNGDTHLGGEDFDRRTIDYLLKVFKKKSGKDATNDKRAVQKLRREVERAKRALSTTTTQRVEIEAFHDGTDFSETLTRAKFEELNIELFKKTLDPVQKVLEDAGFEKKQVDEVVLVGGSTRIPKVQQLLKEFFNGKELNDGVNPDEAVAYGAAVQGAILSGEGGDKTQDVILLDVTPLSLGIATVGDVMNKMIERNSVIPTRVTQDFTTEVDNQREILIEVYEGERAMVKDNRKLGEFTLSGIPPAPRGVPHVDVTFEIDANGILFVSAKDRASGNAEKITITNERGRLSEEEINRMIKDAEANAEKDKKFRRRMDSLHDLQNYLHSVKKTVYNNPKVGDKLADDDKKTMKDAIKDVEKWLKNVGDDADIEDVEDKQREFESIANPIFAKLYQAGVAQDVDADDSSDNDDDFAHHDL